MRIRSVVASLLPFCALISFSSCEIINPAEDTPAYIQINEFTLNPARNASESYGSASHKITDVWVFANGKRIGTFELPAKVPILEKGETKISLLAGVYADGMTTARFPYAFYNQLDQTLSLEPGKVTELQPEVTFNPNTLFPLPINEDFSSSRREFQVTSGPYQVQINTTDLTDFKYANGAVGVVYANPSTVQPAVLESFTDAKLPVNGSAVFLEFDYKSTLDFKVGVLVTRNGVTNRDPNFLNVLRKDSWNKIYLNLTDDATNPNNSGATFKVFFEVPASSNPKDYFAFDNVRLLHF